MPYSLLRIARKVYQHLDQLFVRQEMMEACTDLPLRGLSCRRARHAAVLASELLDRVRAQERFDFRIEVVRHRNRVVRKIEVDDALRLTHLQMGRRLARMPRQDLADGVGPHFGDEALLEEIADSRSLMTFGGDRDRYLWPTHFDLRRIPLRDPAPIYPYSLVYRKDNAHPAIPGLLAYFKTLGSTPVSTTWLP